jgi:hypothetical protein
VPPDGSPHGGPCPVSVSPRPTPAPPAAAHRAGRARPRLPQHPGCEPRHARRCPSVGSPRIRSAGAGSSPRSLYAPNPARALHPPPSKRGDRDNSAEARRWPGRRSARAATQATAASTYTLNRARLLPYAVAGLDDAGGLAMAARVVPVLLVPRWLPPRCWHRRQARRQVVSTRCGRHRLPAAHCTVHSPAHRRASKCQAETGQAPAFLWLQLSYECSIAANAGSSSIHATATAQAWASADTRLPQQPGHLLQKAGTAPLAAPSVQSFPPKGFGSRVDRDGGGHPLWRDSGSGPAVCSKRGGGTRPGCWCVAKRTATAATR